VNLGYHIWVGKPFVPQLEPTLGYTGAIMAKRPKAQCRLEQINHAYLEDLARLGAYGKGKSGVMRRFIENGIRDALEKGVITARKVEDFGGTVAEDDEDED